MSWMIDEILRFLPNYQIECQKISPVLGSISQKLFVIGKDISQMVPRYHDPLSFPSYLCHKQLNRQSAIFQESKDSMCYDNDTGTPELVSRDRDASQSSDEDDHYKILAERVQAVEEMLKAKETKWLFRYKRAMQAYQPTFWDLSDASDSSTGILTPAPVSWTEQFESFSQLIIGRPYQTNRLRTGTAWKLPRPQACP